MIRDRIQRTFRSSLHKANWNPPLPSCEHDENHACPDCNPRLWRPEGWDTKLYSKEVLTKKIKDAKLAYYNGSPIMTDFEYDKLEESLRAICPEAEILKKVGSDPIWEEED